ncbi:hypothetical protein EG850_08595 [Gulosibacter macacae]|uniref:Transcriptional regulator, AbiEi antitoxin, Type IV TA system n=1 Tax=Gulosibacter macacae TaxID=2488791 RepID=A0A3P3VVM4_9MICO|nr:hypothetical protein [Gulosibacter macacae]RRJ86397.1 hypothetical protein EG850_08595 [Gulosibacter macacae]
MQIIFSTDTRSATEWSRRIRGNRDELVRLHVGAYLDPAGTSLDKITAEVRHAARTFAAAQVGDSVISGVSAANLYRLPLLRSRLAERVTVTRTGGGKASRWVKVRKSRLESSEVTQLYGMPVTSLARTVTDLAETLQPFELLALTDGAMRQGFDPGQLPSEGRNARKLRWVKEHASPRSESFGESWSRAILLGSTLPPPKLQVTVLDAQGKFVARADFAWPELGVIGEFDGMIKYGTGLAPGKTLEDVIKEERRREERLQRLGWLVVRWLWSVLHQPDDLLGMLERAHQFGQSVDAPRGSVHTRALTIPKPGDWSELFGTSKFG